jgi:hypothetical protein
VGSSPLCIAFIRKYTERLYLAQLQAMRANVVRLQSEYDHVQTVAESDVCAPAQNKFLKLVAGENFCFDLFSLFSL